MCFADGYVQIDVFVNILIAADWNYRDFTLRIYWGHSGTTN